MFTAIAAKGHIPASPLPEKAWNGPGFLCEAAFTLALIDDEIAREDIQLEPSQPMSNTIKSAEGWYSVVQLVLPRKLGRNLTMLKRARSGDIYQEPPENPAFVSAQFIFVPRGRRRSTVAIEFLKADQPNSRSTDWHVMPQKSYDPGKYAVTLDRFDFSRTPVMSCLNR
ncbi:MAG: hypothetical protein KGL44_07665 [Sphingomonadales bacterium]|nr:hypothetical protein [Sphingomonadales bacterium]